MPASLSQVTANHARIERTMEDGESFYLEYRPAALTPRQMAALSVVQQRAWVDLAPAEQLAAMMATTRFLADSLIATNLLDSQQRPIVCTFEGLQDVSLLDQIALLEMIQEDQKLGEARATANGKGLSPRTLEKRPTATSSPSAPNGI